MACIGWRRPCKLRDPMDPISLLAAGVLAGDLLGGSLSVPWWSWAVLACGLGAASLPRHRLGTALVLPVALVVGLACGAAVPSGPALDGDVCLLGVRVGSASGRAADVELAYLLVEGSWAPAEGRTRVRFTGLPPGPGVAVLVRGRAHAVQRALPGAPDPVRAAALAGARSQVDAIADAPLGGAPSSPIPTELDPTGLMRAILLGDRSGLAADTGDVLRRTGTTHLLSISGFHVGAAAWLLQSVLGRFLRAAGVVRPEGLPSGLLTAASIAGCWLYTALASWPVPAERAAALLTAALVARAAGRTLDPQRWLWLIAAALAVVEPGSAATASYQLSFGAMFGLAWFSSWVTRWWPPDLPAPVRWLIDGLGATFGATVGTLPFAAWWFQAVPPLAPVANLVAMPTLGLSLVPLAAAVATLPSPLREIAAWLGTSLCEIVLIVLEPLAVDPWTPAVTANGALAVALAAIVAARRPAPGVLLGVLVLAAPRTTPAHLRVTFLAVGQGDSALVEWPDGRRWLVDGGPGRDEVLHWLRRSGIRHLDRVVQTHPDADHSRGLRSVLDQLTVDELWADELDPELEVVAAARGIRVRRPAESAPAAASPNDRSLTLSAGPVFFAGDLESAGERRAARALPASIPVLKVAHHGSATSTTAALLDVLRPAVAVISVGAGNPYGHPADSVLERLSRRGVLVLRTDLDGTVVLEATPHQLRIRAEAAR
jgi:competence protein ComEC